MKKQIILVILFFFAFLSQDVFSRGKTALNFLLIGVDAKIISLADAGVAGPPEIGTIYYNPAGLGFYKKNSFILTYRNWLVDGKFIYTAISVPSKLANLAIALTSLSIHDIEIRTRPGQSQGSFTARDLSLAISASPTLSSDFKIGITAKYVFERIFVDKTDLFAFDFGFLYNFKILDLNIFAGASLKDLGPKGKYRISAFNLPTTVSTGLSVSYSVASSGSEILMLIDMKHRVYDNSNLIGFGTGLQLLSTLFLSLGYSLGENSESFRFGIGVNLKKADLYYSFSSLEQNLPDSHTLTFKLKF